MITIVDYDTGNLKSIVNALHRLGAEYAVSSNPSEIAAAEKVLLPGVGEASCAMEKLRQRGLVETLKDLTQPVLGICLGMQLMCSHSEEGDTDCLGIFDNIVILLNNNCELVTLKVPHIGWNDIYNLKSPLFKGIAENSYVYYVHSYSASVNENTIATTSYGVEFSGSLHKRNFFGAQFHPEKSGVVGENILKNFLKL